MQKLRNSYNLLWAWFFDVTFSLWNGKCRKMKYRVCTKKQISTQKPRGGGSPSETSCILNQDETHPLFALTLVRLSVMLWTARLNYIGCKRESWPKLFRKGEEPRWCQGQPLSAYTIHIECQFAPMNNCKDRITYALGKQRLQPRAKSPCLNQFIIDNFPEIVYDDKQKSVSLAFVLSIWKWNVYYSMANFRM